MTTGEYPASMRETMGNRLPTFTEEQKKIVIGSTDFVAINFYFPYMTSSGTMTSADTPSYFKDMNITTTFNSTWPLSQTGWGMYGPGLTDLLVYTKERYFHYYI
jgi:beta-glucosidase